MADSKLVPASDIYSPEFIQELLPCSQQISLLYHISYLCLASFPQLERLLRMRAVETQLLFGSSEAVLLKCVGTSQNLVKSLFPMLIVAVEKQKTLVAQKYLEKARNWIKDIIDEVSKMVTRYDELNKNVTTTTSDVFTAKKETEKAKDQLTQEAKNIETTINKYKDQQTANNKQLTDVEQKINSKTKELQSLISEASSASSGMGLFAAIVPFVGPLAQAIHNKVKGGDTAQKSKTIEIEINNLIADKTFLKQKQWDLQVQEIELQMKMAKIKIDNGCIPDPVHLKEVQCFLSKIQEILIRLKVFWEKIYSTLGTIKDQTFVNEDIFDDPDLKDLFVDSIKSASIVWGTFGEGCERGAQIFRLENKDAYKFLEIDPSSLEKGVWQKEYDDVMLKLTKLNVFGDKKTPAVKKE